MKAEITQIEGTCGLNVVYHYGSKYSWYNLEDLNVDGTGFVVFGFINNSICKEMYREMKQHFTVVYQSPVRVNSNSGNKFFFVIADKKKAK
jgi:hypothetical protein